MPLWQLMYRAHDVTLYNTAHCVSLITDIASSLLNFLSTPWIHLYQKCVTLHNVPKYKNCFKAIVVTTQKMKFSMKERNPEWKTSFSVQ